VRAKLVGGGRRFLDSAFGFARNDRGHFGSTGGLGFARNDRSGARNDRGRFGGTGGFGLGGTGGLGFATGTFDALGALEDEAGTEVLGADVFVSGEFFRGPFLKDGTLVEEVGAVRDGEGFTHVVVGDDDADVAVLELGDDVLDVLHGDGIDTREGFVQEDELRVHGEGAGDFAAAALAAGEAFVIRVISMTDMMLSSTDIWRKTDASCGR